MDCSQILAAASRRSGLDTIENVPVASRAARCRRGGIDAVVAPKSVAAHIHHSALFHGLNEEARYVFASARIGNKIAGDDSGPRSTDTGNRLRTGPPDVVGRDHHRCIELRIESSPEAD